MDQVEAPKFSPNTHTKYFLHILTKGLPSFMGTMDTNRVTLLYFLLSGLDVLDELSNLTDEQKTNIIKWIYSLQVVNNENLVSGFQGSTTMNTKENNGSGSYRWGHVASTYSALVSLLILGDDLSGVDKKAIIKSLKALQNEDGCISASRWGTESDMRFVFCAASVSYILNDWSGLDLEKTTHFILNSMSYENSIGQTPGDEGHGGPTYCGIATLALSGQLHKLPKDRRIGLTRWLLNRVQVGFNGRPNKPIDTCYSFWIGGSLNMLGADVFLEKQGNRHMVLSTQDKYGGFSKWPGTMADPLHTYLGLAGLSLMRLDKLEEIYTPLNVTKRTHERLKDLQSSWISS